MTSIKNKLGSNLLKLFCLVLGTICWALSLLFLYAIIDNFVTVGLVLFITFSFMAVAAVSIGMTVFRTISIDTNSKAVKIKYFGLFETLWTNDLIKGQKAYSRWTKMGIVNKTIIETTDGRQLGFTNFEIEDYEETKGIISTTFQLKEEIKNNEWQIIKKTLFVMLTTMTLVIAFGLIFG